MADATTMAACNSRVGRFYPRGTMDRPPRLAR